MTGEVVSLAFCGAFGLCGPGFGDIDGVFITAPEFSYDVKNVYVDGDHVVLHSQATLKTKHRGDDTEGLNIVDTWKVADDELVEHWAPDRRQGQKFKWGFLTHSYMKVGIREVFSAWVRGSADMATHIATAHGALGSRNRS